MPALSPTLPAMNKIIELEDGEDPPPCDYFVFPPDNATIRYHNYAVAQFSQSCARDDFDDLGFSFVPQNIDSIHMRWQGKCKSIVTVKQYDIDRLNGETWLNDTLVNINVEM